MQLSRRLSFFIFGLSFALSLIFLFALPEAFAARVEKVKDKQILIDAESTDIQVGEKYFIMIDGKKKGVVLISKVKNGKAIGKLTKGRAEVDAGVEPTGKSSKTADNGADGDAPKAKKKKKKKSQSSDDTTPQTVAGFLVGYAMDSQSATLSDGSQGSLSGSGYSLKGFGDVPIGDRMTTMVRGGIEQLNLASGSNSSAIMYLTADILLKYGFSDGSFVPWVAGGMGIHFPLSKSSTYLDVPRISSTTVFFADGGFTMKWGETSSIIGLVEYGMFPPSNDVSTKFITVRGGMAWPW
jgi:hypothetical protein